MYETIKKNMKNSGTGWEMRIYMAGMFSAGIQISC